MTYASAYLRPNKSECRRWHPFNASMRQLMPYVVPDFVSKPQPFPRMSNLTTVFRIDPPTRSGHIEGDGSQGDGRGQMRPSKLGNNGRFGGRA